MSLRIIYGKSGSGKSKFCFDEISKLINKEKKIHALFHAEILRRGKSRGGIRGTGFHENTGISGTGCGRKLVDNQSFIPWTRGVCPNLASKCRTGGIVSVGYGFRG